METLIEEGRYGDGEEWDEGERVMEGNGEDKEIEKGGHSETMKKDGGGRPEREGKCVSAKRKKVQKDRFKMERKGKR